MTIAMLIAYAATAAHWAGIAIALLGAVAVALAMEGIHHPAVAGGILIALLALRFAFSRIDVDEYEPATIRWDEGAKAGANSDEDVLGPQGARRDRDGFDYDFDDYKLTDPDWAVHGYRSGDKIEDQRTHDRWEHCQEG